MIKNISKIFDCVAGVIVGAPIGLVVGALSTSD